MQGDEQITELICTRISHDIIGNVGAVANAVELLEEGDLDFLDDIKSILKTSSRVLTARLKFFRLAFGLSNKNLEDIPHLTQITTDYLQTIGNVHYPITLDLELHTAEYTRVALLVIMILADIIIKGGKIEAREAQGQFAAIIHSKAPLAIEKINNIKQILSDRNIENQAQYAPVVYLQKVLNNTKKINMVEENTFGFIIR